jgi:hypothetical protein
MNIDSSSAHCTQGVFVPTPRMNIFCLFNSTNSSVFVMQRHDVLSGTESEYSCYIGHGCKNPGRPGDWKVVAGTWYISVVISERALFRLSDVWDSEVAPTFFWKIVHPCFRGFKSG